MTQLRQQMIRAMELKNLSANTQRAYLAAVTGISNYYNQCPDTLTKQMIEDYLLYLKNDKGNAPHSWANCGTMTENTGPSLACLLHLLTKEKINH